MGTEQYRYVRKRQIDLAQKWHFVLADTRNFAYTYMFTKRLS